MQIQRWQSLFLLIAAALMGAINFLSYATLADGTQLFTTQATVLLVVNVIVAVLLFALIFMYKNLRMQMRMTTIAIVLLLLFAADTAIVACNAGAQIAWCGAFPLYVVSLILTIAARRLMRRDSDLLRSADRLR